MRYQLTERIEDGSEQDEYDPGKGHEPARRPDRLNRAVDQTKHFSKQSFLCNRLHCYLLRTLDSDPCFARLISPKVGSDPSSPQFSGGSTVCQTSPNDLAAHSRCRRSPYSGVFSILPQEQDELRSTCVRMHLLGHGSEAEGAEVVVRCKRTSTAAGQPAERQATLCRRTCRGGCDRFSRP